MPEPERKLSELLPLKQSLRGTKMMKLHQHSLAWKPWYVEPLRG